MRLASLPKGDLALDSDLPLWPPLLATRAMGGKSALHAHHAMHIVLAIEGELRAKVGKDTYRGAGIVTAPDTAHAIDAAGIEVLLVFFDPESEVGASLRSVLLGPVRVVTAEERNKLVEESPMAIMQEDGLAWTNRAVRVLGGPPVADKRQIHPRVRKLLRLLRAAPPEHDRDTSLENLAAEVGLSPGRLMHAFSESIGIPLRPYLAWLRMQRAAAAIASGMPLGHAAHAAGFSDAAHMTRTFRRMFGMAPSALRGHPSRGVAP